MLKTLLASDILGDLAIRPIKGTQTCTLHCQDKHCHDGLVQAMRRTGGDPASLCTNSLQQRLQRRRRKKIVTRQVMAVIAPHGLSGSGEKI